MRNAGLDDLQAGIKIGRRNLNNLRYADDTTLMAERAEELKSLLMRVKEESGESQLKTKYWGKKQDHGIPPHSCLASRGGEGGNGDKFPVLGL